MSSTLSPAEMLFNMILQAIILILAIYGFYNLKTTGDRRKHGIIFSIATILNLLSLVAIMIPALVYEWNDLVQNPLGLDSFITIIHHIIGLVAAALSVIIVVSWGNRSLPEWDRRGKLGKACLGEGRTGRMIMQATFILWVVSFALGALIYGAEFLSS